MLHEEATAVALAQQAPNHYEYDTHKTQPTFGFTGPTVLAACYLLYRQTIKYLVTHHDSYHLKF